MKDNFAQYFDKPEFRSLLARYEEMINGERTFYFEATELTDIAEYYDADEELPAGTLVQFGGTNEITKAKDCVNAVISSADLVV